MSMVSIYWYSLYFMHSDDLQLDTEQDSLEKGSQAFKSVSLARYDLKIVLDVRSTDEDSSQAMVFEEIISVLRHTILASR